MQYRCLDLVDVHPASWTRDDATLSVIRGRDVDLSAFTGFDLDGGRAWPPERLTARVDPVSWGLLLEPVP